MLMLMKLSDEGVCPLTSKHTRAYVYNESEAWTRIRDMLCAIPKGAGFVIYVKKNNRYEGCTFCNSTGVWNPVGNTMKVKGLFSEFEGFGNMETYIRRFGVGGRELEVGVTFYAASRTISIFPFCGTPPRWTVPIRDVMIGYTSDGSWERYEDLELWESVKDVGQT